MIEITQEMADRIHNALANRTPCLLVTVSPEGYPDIGPKGSVMVFDKEHLAYWERTRRGQHRNVEANPKVAIYYYDLPGRVHWRFYGAAEVHKDGPIREQIMARTIKAELDRDPERKGYGVLVRVDRITNLAGQVLQQRE